MNYPIKDTPIYLKSEDRVMTRIYAKIEFEGDILYLIKSSGIGGALPINKEDKVHWISSLVQGLSPTGFYNGFIWVPPYGYDGEHHNAIENNEQALSLLESE